MGLERLVALRSEIGWGLGFAASSALLYGGIHLAERYELPLPLPDSHTGMVLTMMGIVVGVQLTGGYVGRRIAERF